jgi:hypothetical protein
MAMSGQTDIIIFGTGNFAARILFDLAATAPSGLSVAIVGRNAPRLAWLRTAAAARAAMFGTGVRVADHRLDLVTSQTAAGLLAALQPGVVLNTASAQGGRIVTATSDRWTRLVQEGGLGVTAILQARISLEVSRAVAAALPGAHFINCCYPDVVNAMIAGAGLPITSGIGNVAILAHAFAGLLGPGHGRLQLLAQHAALAAFRRPPEERVGKVPPRVWLDGRELDDVFARFAAVQLAPEPVIDISGASGVPLLVAMLGGQAWRGHLPGPNGLPGGYPVRLDDGALTLDLPLGLNPAEAIGWNAAFEEKNGVVVGADGAVRYTGKVEQVLRGVSPELAAGFVMRDFAAADHALSALRARLLQET